MNDDFTTLLIIITVTIVTFTLRMTPFILMDKISSSQYLKYIGNKMPIGIMIILVAYTFIDTDFLNSPYGVPQLISSLAVLALYWYLKNSLIAIAIGLMTYLTLVNSNILML
ncbi:AzlD domain-containing protein [Endozoicomonas gorgoniicola]|uniref:AzlD domain-containing protein n=1 Tax=Endozoicomonas gorgoniicola TaxID=1234144 RepID=A0ABT3N484_9GAMM|nr:AzlD domain-containing protein [Endozoicomonas gorgoniicola]MCW7556019.1 AzlD domain-containing protein [Endozoicomonas gorgoniicola]